MPAGVGVLDGFIKSATDRTIGVADDSAVLFLLLHNTQPGTHNTYIQPHLHYSLPSTQVNLVNSGIQPVMNEQTKQTVTEHHR